MKPKSTPDRVLGLRFPRAFVQRMRAVQCMRPEMLRQGLKRTVEEAEASIRAALKDGSIQFVQPRFLRAARRPAKKGELPAITKLRAEERAAKRAGKYREVCINDRGLLRYAD